MSEYVQDQLEKAGKMAFTSVEAEENILRRMFQKQDVAEELVNELKPSDFSRPQFAMIFRAIQGVVRKGRQVDMVTVDAAFSAFFPNKKQELAESMAALALHQPYTLRSTQPIKDHVQIVKDLSARRQAITRLEGLMAGLQDPGKAVKDTLTEVQEVIEQIDRDEAEWVGISDVLLKTYDYIEKRQRGEIKSITTGLSSLDRLIGGFFAGELTVVGARPSVGKSAFGANIALAAARKGFKVGIVSCEMVDIGYGQRLLSHGAWVDGMKLRKGDVDEESWGKLAEAMTEMGGLPVEFMFTNTYIEDVVKTAKRKARRGELDILVADYLQLLETRRKFEAEHLRVGYISRLLKKLAIEANIPVIALAQVNRNTDGSMPTLKHLKDSGSIEQDCDGVIFLHRPKDRNDSSIDPRDVPYFEGYEERGMVYLCIGVAKQRQGAIGQSCVIFDPSLMQYIEIDRTAKEPGGGDAG